MVKIYNPSTDTNREITQEDVEKLQVISFNFGALRRILKKSDNEEMKNLGNLEWNSYLEKEKELLYGIISPINQKD